MMLCLCFLKLGIQTLLLNIIKMSMPGMLYFYMFNCACSGQHNHMDHASIEPLLSKHLPQTVLLVGLLLPLVVNVKYHTCRWPSKTECNTHFTYIHKVKILLH